MWIGIQHGEVHGPDHFTEVNDIRHQCVCGAQGERNLIKRADGPRPLLNEISNDRRCGTERKQRNLLGHKPGKSGEPIPWQPVTRPVPSAEFGRHAPQRPDVEQQEQERECDKHRLGHQPQCEADQHAQIAAGGRPSHVCSVRPKGEQEEQRAEDVLSFRHPGHRLHVKRMDGEERGDAGTPARSARHVDEDPEQQECVG